MKSSIPKQNFFYRHYCYHCRIRNRHSSAQKLQISPAKQPCRCSSTRYSRKKETQNQTGRIVPLVETIFETILSTRGPTKNRGRHLPLKWPDPRELIRSPLVGAMRPSHVIKLFAIRRPVVNGVNGDC